MKTKSRKRLLISSVAMLLVAMLALGTATFAWFTTNTTVTANGIKVRTSKTSQLLISDDTSEYLGNGFSYTGFSSIMVPASSADGQKWFFTTAKDKDKFTAENASSFKLVEDNSKNRHVYVNQLNIKNGGDVSISNIKIDINGMDSECDYLRVALVPVSAKHEGGDPSMSADVFKANVYGNTSDTAPNNLTYYPVESATKISENAITPNNEKTITVGTLEAGKEAHYNLYVWFEGQDPKCFDGKAGQGVKDLSFTVTGVPVSETN